MKTILNIIEKGDLKSIKTKKALYTALLTLLQKGSFEKITVRNICEEALISRVAFYAHFADKYDFLRSWLVHLIIKGALQDCTYAQMAELINAVMNKYKKPIRNLIREARQETLEVLFEIILTTLDFSAADEADDEKNIIVSNFYAGGMLFYFLRQIDRRFPQNMNPMNEYLHEIMNYFQAFLDKGD